MENIDIINDIVNEEELDNESYEYYRNQMLMNGLCECYECNRFYGIDNNSELLNTCLECYNNRTDTEEESEEEEEEE